MVICRLKSLLTVSLHTVFVIAVSSGFKLVYISWLIWTDTSLYQSFVFFAELKRFSLDLTALFSVAWSVNTSALVSSRCALRWAAEPSGYGPCGAVQMSSVVLFRFSRINSTSNVYWTCFIEENYITIIIVIVLSPSPASKYICSRAPGARPQVENHWSRPQTQNSKKVIFLLTFPLFHVTFAHYLHCVP